MRFSLDVLDNVELIIYIQFQKLLMAGCRNMNKKHQKYSKNRALPHLWPPKIFFKKSGSVTFVPLWCPNFMHKLKKTNELFMRYLKQTNEPIDKGTEEQTKAIARGPKLMFCTGTHWSIQLLNMSQHKKDRPFLLYGSIIFSFA